MKRPSADLILLAITTVALIVLIASYNLSGSIKALENINPYYLLIAFGFWILYTMAKFLPWTHVLKKVGIRAPVFRSILLVYAFFGLGFLPVVGPIVPLRYLDHFRKNARFSSIGIIFSLTTVAGLAAILMAIFSAIFVSQYVAYFIALFAVAYAAFSFLGADLTHRKLDSLLTKVLRPKKFSVSKKIMSYLNSFRKERKLMSQREILTGIAMFLPSLLAETAMLFFILLSFNQSISFIAVMFIFTVSITLGNLSFLPGGVGPTEASMIALLLLFGSPGAIAISATIIFRIFNVLFVVLAGYGSLAVVKTIKTKRRLV